MIAACTATLLVAGCGNNGADGGRTVIRADPDQARELLEQTAGRLLGRSADVGSGRVVALAADWSELSAADLADADALYVQFGQEGRHTWKVFLGAAADAPAGGERSESGDRTVSSTLVAVRAPEDVYGPGRYIAAGRAPLKGARLASSRFERQVRTFHPDGTMTSVTETVFGPTSSRPEDVFSSSQDELKTVSQDPTIASIATTF